MVVGDGEIVRACAGGHQPAERHSAELRAPAPFSDGCAHRCLTHWARPTDPHRAAPATTASDFIRCPTDRCPDRAACPSGACLGGGGRTRRSNTAGGVARRRPIGAPHTHHGLGDLHAAAVATIEAALWDNVEDRFAVYDDLADARTVTALLLVAGWYRRRTRPLHLGPIRWHIRRADDPPRLALDRARLEAVRAEMARAGRPPSVGLTSLPDRLLAGRADGSEPARRSPIPGRGGPRAHRRAHQFAYRSRQCHQTTSEAAAAIGSRAHRLVPSPIAVSRCGARGSARSAGRADGEARSRFGAGRHRRDGHGEPGALVAADLPGTDDDQERLRPPPAYGILDRLDDADGIPRRSRTTRPRVRLGAWRLARSRSWSAIRSLRSPAPQRPRGDKIAWVSRSLMFAKSSTARSVSRCSGHRGWLRSAHTPSPRRRSASTSRPTRGALSRCDARRRAGIFPRIR